MVKLLKRGNELNPVREEEFKEYVDYTCDLSQSMYVTSL